MKLVLSLLAFAAFFAAGEFFYLKLKVAHKNRHRLKRGFSSLGRWARKRRQDRFEKQLTMALRLLAGSVRAGQSLPQALITTANESSSPLKEEFETVSAAVSLGTPVEDALNTLAAEFKGHACGKELVLMSSAVAINRSTGGPLADLLTQLVETVQERQRLKEQVAALTAQGVMSGWIVGLLPVFLLFTLWIMDPALVEPMFTTGEGIILLVIGAIFETIGALLIRRIVRVV